MFFCVSQVGWSPLCLDTHISADFQLGSVWRDIGGGVLPALINSQLPHYSCLLLAFPLPSPNSLYFQFPSGFCFLIGSWLIHFSLIPQIWTYFSSEMVAENNVPNNCHWKQVIYCNDLKGLLQQPYHVQQWGPWWKGSPMWLFLEMSVSFSKSATILRWQRNVHPQISENSIEQFYTFYRTERLLLKHGNDHVLTGKFAFVNDILIVFTRDYKMEGTIHWGIFLMLLGTKDLVYPSCYKNHFLKIRYTVDIPFQIFRIKVAKLLHVWIILLSKCHVTPQTINFIRVKPRLRCCFCRTLPHT